MADDFVDVGSCGNLLAGYGPLDDPTYQAQAAGPEALPEWVGSVWISGEDRAYECPSGLISEQCVNGPSPQPEVVVEPPGVWNLGLGDTEPFDGVQQEAAATSPPSVKGGLADAGPASDGLETRIRIAVFQQFLQGRSQGGFADAGCPSPGAAQGSISHASEGRRQQRGDRMDIPPRLSHQPVGRPPQARAG